MARVPRLPLGIDPIARSWLLTALLSVAASASHAAEVVVRVTGLMEPLGQVGCSLSSKSDPSGFPMDNASARNVWLCADTGRPGWLSGVLGWSLAVRPRRGQVRVQTRMMMCMKARHVDSG